MMDNPAVAIMLQISGPSGEFCITKFGFILSYIVKKPRIFRMRGFYANQAASSCIAALWGIFLLLLDLAVDKIIGPFIQIKSFQNRLDFFNKASTYQLFFNLHRPNSYKEHKTPWQLAQEKKPDLDKLLLMVPPVDLDKLLSWKTSLSLKGGNDHLTVPFS